MQAPSEQYRQETRRREPRFYATVIASLLLHCIAIAGLIALDRVWWFRRPTLPSIDADLVLLKELRTGTMKDAESARPKALRALDKPKPQSKRPTIRKKSEAKQKKQTTQAVKKEAKPLTAAERRKKMQAALGTIQHQLNRSSDLPKKNADEGGGVDQSSVSETMLRQIYKKQVKRKIIDHLHVTDRALWFGRWRRRTVLYHVVLLEGGQIRTITLQDSSGVEQMDQIVKQAIVNAAPFTLPAGSLRNELLKQGLVIDVSPSYMEETW